MHSYFHEFQTVHLGSFFPKLSSSSHLGDKAVEMFFIISGFMLLYTYKDNLTIIDYLKKRIARFVPVLLFLYVAYWVLSIFTGFKFDKYGSIFNVLMISNIGITLNSGSIGGSWFLSVLLFSSLFYLCVIKYFKTRSMFIIGVITYFSFVILVQLTNGALGGHIKTFYIIFNLGMIRGLACIGLGILLCSLYKQLKPAGQKLFKINTFALVSLLEIYLLIFLINNLIFHQFSYNNKLILIIAFVILFWLFLLQRGLLSKMVAIDIFPKISRYTFSIYITHLFVFRLLAYTLWKAQINVNLIAFFTFFISIIFGILVYHIIELPCYKFMQKMLDIHKKPMELTNK